MNLRPFDGACPAAAAVLPDEDDEQPFDEEEDRPGEADDDPVGRNGVARVRRFRLNGRQAAVRSCRDTGRRECGQDGENEGRQLPAHPLGIL